MAEIAVKILISSKEHPIYEVIKNWGKYDELALKKSELTKGGILFLISCSEIIDSEFRKNFDAVIVLHASDLPNGRGWSPHIWQIIEGKNGFTVSAISAEDKVDTGDIWAQRKIEFEGHELYDEINGKLFKAEIELIEEIAAQFQAIKPQRQKGEGSYYKKRTPEDSRLDANKSIAEQFNQLRVADPVRYPAFFELNGKKYKIKIEKYD